MSDVHDNIVSWLHEQKYWLQIAAKKLLDQEDVTDEDISELSELLKTTDGQQTEKKVDFTSFLGSDKEYGQLRINSIGDIQGIENLAPRVPLTFEDKNLAVIYGNNGSGKSGYTRILKKACGKPHALNLNSNVFEPEPEVRQCVIGFNDGDTEYSETWEANSDAIDALVNVDIFDSHSGNLYLDSENSAAYIPETVALFEDLVVVCRRVKAVLDSEKNLLKSNLPTIPPSYSNTKYGAELTKLKSDIDKDTLRDFFEFSEEDIATQESIEERLKDSPNVLAQNKGNHKKQLEMLVNTVNEAVNKVNVEACEKVFQFQNRAKEKRKIAVEGASVSSLDKAILPGIGTETWLALWDAAKAYSITTAYPEIKYPKTEDGSLCVLCHQSLDEDAKQRLQGFDSFVNSTLEKDAETAANNYKDVLDELPSIPSEEQLKTSLQAAKLDEDVWFSVFYEIWGNIQQVINDLKKEHDEMLTGYVLPEEVFKPIVELTESIEEQIQQHDSDAENFDKDPLTKDLNDLKAKQWASGYIDAIIEEVDRLGEIQSYEQWTEFTNPRAISIKAGDVSKEVITEAYIDRFNSELVSLGAKNIKVELVKTRVEHGKVKHKVQLRGVVSISARAPEILSEGEHRIVALAAFLADVTGKPQKSPFIFDDPISSLDQVFEERTIDRLISLSEDRQVLIFTHRLSFLGLINDKANPYQTHIRKEPWGCGEQGQIPLFAKKPIKAIKDLRNNRLKRAKKVLNENGADEYYPLAKSICSDFRILIERIVECDFLADVIQRHRRDVHTKNKIMNLSKINSTDCELIEQVMTDFSSFEHSQSWESPVEVPSPEELEVSLDSVINWHEEFRKR
mgnify:CR=1 FL=1